MVCYLFLLHTTFAISSMIGLLNMHILMQAIKVLNMIKLYGKPIRVNKVHSSFISCITFFYLLAFLLQCPILFLVRFTKNLECQYPGVELEYIYHSLIIGINVELNLSGVLGFTRQEKFRCRCKSFCGKS